MASHPGVGRSSVASVSSVPVRSSLSPCSRLWFLQAAAFSERPPELKAASLARHGAVHVSLDSGAGCSARGLACGFRSVASAESGPVGSDGEGRLVCSLASLFAVAVCDVILSNE